MTPLLRSKLRSKIAMGIGIAALILGAQAWGADAVPRSASPGTLNYVEGKVSVDDAAVSAGAVGKVDLQSGQSISTQEGKTEVLLTPGVFFRLGDESSATMNS